MNIELILQSLTKYFVAVRASDELNETVVLCESHKAGGIEEGEKLLQAYHT